MMRREDLADVDLADLASEAALPPLKPGEMLLEEFMRPAGLTAGQLAAEFGMSDNLISSIVAGSRRLTAETAILLGRRFKTSVELWMNLQSAHDLAVARATLREAADLPIRPA